MKIIICAGERLKNDWITHDVQDLPNIDIVCDFWKLPNYTKDKYEQAEFTHALEHFPMKESVRALQMIRELLTPGAQLYIEVPNFSWHAKEIIANPRNRQIVEYAFGGQLNKWDFHYNGFTPEILEEDLAKAGFQVRSLEPNSTIECTAIKI